MDGLNRQARVIGMPLHLHLRRAIRLAFVLVSLLVGLCATTNAQADPTPSADASQTVHSVPAGRFAKNIAVITVDTGDGMIDWITAYSIKRRIAEAEAAGAGAIVFQVNTLGGELGAMLEIAEAIKQSSIKNTVAWVNVRAYSAGALISLACREIVVSENGVLGDAAPIIQGASLAPTERAKVLTPLLTEVVDSARRNGYDEKFVQGFVTLGVELWLVENSASGERLFVDRSEYKLLFPGQEPPTSSPALASAPSSVINAPTIQAPGAPPSGIVFPRIRGPRSSGSGGSGGRGSPPASSNSTSTAPSPNSTKAPAPADGSGFVPASPAISGQTVADVNIGLDQPTLRPVLTTADAGQWKLVEYVSDGNGLFTLKAPSLMRYGLASRVVSNDDELKAFFGATNLSRIEPAWSEGLVRFLVSPITRGVLIVIFLLSLFLEMTHPGLVLPGTVAAVALIVLLAPPLLVGMAAWWEIAAIFLGIILIALEIFVLPGFGIFGIIGLLLLFGGLLGTFVPRGGSGLFPDTSEGQSSLLYGLATLVISTAVSMVGMYFLGKHFGSLPFLNKFVLQAPGRGEEEESLLAAIGPEVDGPVVIGAVGRSITPLRPSGRAQFGEQYLDVVADMGLIPAERPVRVIEVSPFRIVVEQVTGSSGAGHQPGPGGVSGGVA